MSEYRAKWAFIDTNGRRVPVGEPVTGEAKYLAQLEAKGLIAKRKAKPAAPPENKAADTGSVENKAPARKGRPPKAAE